MNGRKLNEAFALVCIYKNSNPEFWDYILRIAGELFNHVIVFNSSFEPLITENSSIETVLYDIEDYPKALLEYFGRQKKLPEFFFLLEENEELIIGENSLTELYQQLKEGEFYNLSISAAKSEVFEYEAEPFKTIETRLFSCKNSDFLKSLEKSSFYRKDDYETIDSELVYISKSGVDANFEVLKARAYKDQGSPDADFVTANAYFYKDSLIAEDYYQKIIDADSQFSPLALTMLQKLLLRRTAYQYVWDISKKYEKMASDNPLYFLYYGFSSYELREYKLSLKLIHQALKLKDKIPYIYNASDINWKALYYIATNLYLLKRFKFAEKFFLMAKESLKDRLSPDLLLMLARTKFSQKDYDSALEYFRELFAIEDLPLGILRASRDSFFNLLLFAPFKDELIDILLNKKYFDSSEEILRIADTYFMGEQYEEALKLYNLIIGRFSYSNKLLFKLGYICSKLRLMEPAANYFEAYLEKEPDDLDALSNLAFIYLVSEKLENAEKAYHKILEKNNYSFEANLYLAIIYMSMGNKGKAEKYISQAKTLNPVSPEIIKLQQIFKAEFK